MSHQLDTTLKNDLAEIPRLAEEVERFGEAAGLPMKTVFRINLVMDELLTNAISYGYRDRSQHEIRIKIHAEDGKVAVDIIDDGAPFNPVDEAPAPDLESEVDDRQIGGLGLHLVRNMVERVGYARDDVRNHLTLVISADAE
jgi:anti-sigma regulatory factor (Ser/Thr protein kinase)